MENPQSLTPEVIEILSEIRDQAHQYNQAFETFYALVKKTEEAQYNSEEHLKDIKSEINRITSEFQQASLESTSKIDAKIASIDYMFQELSAIQKVKSSLAGLEETFKKNTSALSVVVDNIKSLVVRQVQKESEQIDRKTTAIHEEFTERFAIIEQRIEEIQEQERRNFIMLDEEIGQFKSKVQETKYIVDEAVKLVNLLVEKAERELYSKFSEARDNMTELLTHLERSAKKSEERVSHIIRDADLANLPLKVVANTSRINDMQIRLGMAFWVSLISLIINVCLIAAFLFVKS